MHVYMNNKIKDHFDKFHWRLFFLLASFPMKNSLYSTLLAFDKSIKWLFPALFHHLVVTSALSYTIFTLNTRTSNA